MRRESDDTNRPRRGGNIQPIMRARYDSRGMGNTGNMGNMGNSRFRSSPRLSSTPFSLIFDFFRMTFVISIQTMVLRGGAGASNFVCLGVPTGPPAS